MREDLYAHEGTLILGRGETITRPILDEIKHKRARPSNKTTRLKETHLPEDFLRVMKDENYRIIFDQQTLRQRVLDLVGEMVLNDDILEELDFCKIKDYYTYRHILITTIMTARMAQDLYQDSKMALTAASTALTHDFGKSRIPLEILQSTKKLTYEQYLYIHEHPWIGFLLLVYYTGEHESMHALVALNHHEKMDGSGYPRGVKVVESLIQFVTINDIFDALISQRPYRLEPFNIRGALDYLCDEAEGGKLNMTGVKLLLSYNRHSKPPLDTMVYSQSHLGYRPPDEVNNYTSHEGFQKQKFGDRIGSEE